jgi:hypothetical protein
MMILMGSTTVQLLNGIRTNGTPCLPGSTIPFDEGLYHFLQKKEVNLTSCDPFVFLKNVNHIMGGG